MTTKEYLQQAQVLERRIRLDKEKIIAMRSSLYGHSIRLDSDGSQHQPNSKSREQALFRVMEYEERVNAEIEKLIAKKLEIENVIASIPDEVQQEILTRRYLLYQKWEDIADKMNFSRQHITRLHKAALRRINIT